MILWCHSLLSNIQRDHCWCKDLIDNIEYSRNKLIDRYGYENLERLTVFASSGKLNILETRLYQALQHNKTFHIGIKGGSYSLPEKNRGNAWSFNVTRWLNAILSARECHNDKSINLRNLVTQNIKEGVCSNDYDITNQFYKCKLMNETSLQSLFCFKFVDYENELSYIKHRPINLICDNSLPPIRECLVFRGSGKYATMEMSSKGGSNSFDATWSIHNASPRKLDLILLDYSVNDYAGLHQHKCLFEGLFEQTILQSQTNIAGFGIVYWFDQLMPLFYNCVENYQKAINFTNNLATFDYPLLKSIFDPTSDGKFSNLTLLTMSLGSFCDGSTYNAFCSPNEFVNLTNLHPSEMGMSVFGDLFIYQLLKPFDYIISKYCKAYNQFVSQLLRSGHIWVDDSHINNTLKANPFSKKDGSIYNAYNDNAIKLYQLNQRVLPSWRVVTSLIFTSPQIKGPIPQDMFSILCVPSLAFPVNDTASNFSVYFGESNRSLITNLNMFDVNYKLDLNNRLDDYFIQVDIILLMNNKCAGWNHIGERLMYRPDDDHEFSPTITVDCPSGSTPFKQPCVKPISWLQSKEMPHYPHTKIAYFYPEIVKVVDLVFKISNDLDWFQACFTLCKPRIVYRQKVGNYWLKFSSKKQSIWKSRYLVKTMLHESPRDLMTSCYKKDFKFTKDEIVNNEYFLVYSADACYPWNKNNTNWGVSITNNLYLLDLGS